MLRISNEVFWNSHFNDMLLSKTECLLTLKRLVGKFDVAWRFFIESVSWSCFIGWTWWVLLIMCIAVPLASFCSYLMLMSKRMHLIQKFVVFKVIAAQNTPASLYSVLMYQVKFSLPPPSYQILKNFPTPSLFIKF